MRLTIAPKQPADLRMSIANLEAIRYGIDTDFTRSLLQGIALFRGVDTDTIADLLPRCGRIDVPRVTSCFRRSARTTASTSY